MAHRHSMGLHLAAIIIRSILAAILLGAAVVVTLIAILGTIGGGIPGYVWLVALGLFVLGAMAASVHS